MTQTASTIVQVGIDRLPALHASLNAALSEAGFSNGQLGEIFSKFVSAECVLCGIRVTGEEMGSPTGALEKTAATNSKMDRLRCGSCAKPGCISSYYRVHLREYPGLDWVSIREEATEDQAFEGAKAARKRLVIRVVLGMCVILILLLCRYILYYGHVPLLQKPHKYTVDPASVDPGPSR